MAMWGSDITREQLLQKISLLAKLGSVKDDPRQHNLSPSSDTGYFLTIEQEAEIVDNLAFVSYRRKDTQNVTALCMEEDENGEGIVIRLAVNGGALWHIENGLRQICAMLEEIAQRKSYNLEEFLERIIELDATRISGRLKLGRKYRDDRSPAVRLHKTLHEKYSTEVAGLAGLREKSKKIRDLYNRLKDPATSLLGPTKWHYMKEIIKITHELSRSSQLSVALAQSSLNKTQRAAALDWVGKLGQYYRASYKLVSAASRKTCKLFQRIRVESFQIDVPNEVRYPLSPGSALPLIRSVLRSSHASKLLERLGGSESKANSTLLKRLDGTRLGIKVHAEIKLLFFYETHPRIRRPRVMCANKDACYLCDLFFRVHGQFQLLRTFGKLSERWILPDWLNNISDNRLASLKATIEQFSCILDSQITSALEERVRKPNPLESTLCLSASWSDTAAAKTASSASKGERRIELHTESQYPSSLFSQCLGSTWSSQKPVLLWSRSSILIVEDIPSPAGPLMDREILHTGATTKKQLTGDQAFLLHVRKTYVTLSFNLEEDSEGDISKGFWVYVHLRLPWENTDSCLTEDVIPVDRIQGELTLNFNENQSCPGFHIRWRNQIVSFKFSAIDRG